MWEEHLATIIAAGSRSHKQFNNDLPDLLNAYVLTVFLVTILHALRVLRG